MADLESKSPLLQPPQHSTAWCFPSVQVIYVVINWLLVLVIKLLGFSLTPVNCRTAGCQILSGIRNSP